MAHFYVTCTLCRRRIGFPTTSYDRALEKTVTLGWRWVGQRFLCPECVRLAPRDTQPTRPPGA